MLLREHVFSANRARHVEIATRGAVLQRVLDALHLSAAQGHGVALSGNRKRTGHIARPLACPVRYCSGSGPQNNGSPGGMGIGVGAACGGIGT
jgi:hypothetical protein